MTGAPPANAKFTKTLIKSLATGGLIDQNARARRAGEPAPSFTLIIEHVAIIMLEILRPTTPFDDPVRGNAIWRDIQAARANSYLRHPEIETDPDAWLAYAAQCIESFERNRLRRYDDRIDICAALLNAILKPNIDRGVIRTGAIADGNESDNVTHLHPPPDIPDPAA